MIETLTLANLIFRQTAQCLLYVLATAFPIEPTAISTFNAKTHRDYTLSAFEE